MAHKPKKRSLTITGHRTSISLEDDFWDALKAVARDRGQSVSAVISEIDTGRQQYGLSSAIRSVILAHYRDKSR